MKKIASIFIAMSLLSASVPLLATTVIPPTFSQLVNDAEFIFQGTVTATRSAWVGEGAQRHIATYVTFSVEDTVKGNPGSSYTISMLGGTVGDDTMEIAGAPKFKVGNRDLLFVEHNGEQFVPLVGIMHGRFHVQRDQSGRDVVLTDDKAPLSNPQSLGSDEQSARNGAAMTVDEFKGAVRNRLNQGLSRPGQ